MRTTARPTARRLLALPAILAALLVAACGAGTGDLGSVATPPATPGGSLDVPSAEPTPAGTAATPTASPGSSPGSSPAQTTTVRAYFFLGSFTGDSGLVPVLREVPYTLAVGAASLQALIAGPNETELAARPAMYTDIPDGTKVLRLEIDGGTANVQLSREFAAGGDAAALRGRAAQVVFTLTQFPSVTAVNITVEGSSSNPAAPYTRLALAEGVLPAIWVDRPAWGGVLANPGRVTGLANTFEAAFRMQVLDAAGHSLVNVPAMASCGTGCWGTFDVTLHDSVPSAQWGTLRVYELSAKDGSRQHVVDYPVWLAP